MDEEKFEEGKLYRIAKIGIRDVYYWLYRKQFRGSIVEFKHYFKETNHSKGYIACVVILKTNIDEFFRIGTVLPFKWIKLTEI